MDEEKQAKPIPTISPATDTMLEHHLINSHQNAEKTHGLLEHHLINGEKNAKVSHALAESHLEMQGKMLEEMQKPKPDVQKVELVGAEVVTIKGVKGDDGHTPTPEELTALITPLIPAPVKGDDGKTPTEDELKNLITPLIPPPIKGEPGIKGESIKGDPGDPGTVAEVDYPKIWDYIMAKVSEIKVPTFEDISKFLKSAPKEMKISYSDLADAPEFPKMAGTGYLREITDVSVQNVQVGQTIVWDGRKWIPQTPSSSGVTNVYGEVLVMSGSNFTLANAPLAGTVRVYRNGSYQQQGAGNDYTISGASGTVANAPDPSANEIFLADYSY